MTATPPDPDPARTPGLEAGGGVTPGDTPPDSGQTPGPPDPPIPSRAVPVVALVLVGVLTLLALAFVIAQVMGWTRLY